MSDDRDQIGYSLEALSAALVGERLKGVRYFDTPCFDVAELDESWPAEGVHAPAHGIDLVFAARCVGVTWGTEFSRYNIQMVPFSLVDFLLAARFSDVRERAPWADLLGHVIETVSVEWLPRHGDDSTIRFPLALVLGFDNDMDVALAAAAYRPGDAAAVPGGDDIVVAWREAQLRTVLPDLQHVADRWAGLST